MFVGTAYRIKIVSLFDISDELKIVENILFKWNRKYSSDRDKLLFYDDFSKNRTEDKKPDSENHPEYRSDLTIAIFWTKSSVPIYDKNDDKEKDFINKIYKYIDNKKPILIYFIEKNVLDKSTKENDNLIKFKLNIKENQKVVYRECSEEDLEFSLTCDISAFDVFNNETIIEYGTANIQIKPNNNEGNVIYLLSYIVNSNVKPVTYRDRIIIKKNKNCKIYEPEESTESPESPKSTKLTILNYDQFTQHNNTYLEYEIKNVNESEDKLSFTGEIRTMQKLTNGIGFHIPYYAKHLIINIFCTKKLEDCSAKLYKEENKKEINIIFNKDSNIYTIVLNDVEADSNLNFMWKSISNNKSNN